MPQFNCLNPLETPNKILFYSNTQRKKANQRLIVLNDTIKIMGEGYSKGWDSIKAGILSNLPFSAMHGETKESRELRRGLKGKEKRRGELREERGR